jgi:putative acetyltransferase
MNHGIALRPFVEEDANQVRELFIVVNRLLAPPHMQDAFEAYIGRSLTEEIDRIVAYYGERDGGFWVALRDDTIVGMFGLERIAPDAMELRRMYVDPSAQRGGIGRQMLYRAEAECRRRGIARLELSTSEMQSAALALYRTEGYALVREATAEAASNKTVGAGIRRYYFAKTLYAGTCNRSKDRDPTCLLYYAEIQDDGQPYQSAPLQNQRTNLIRDFGR